MINIAFGIALIIVFALVQYSWFFDTNNGLAIDFKSKKILCSNEHWISIVRSILINNRDNKHFLDNRNKASDVGRHWLCLLLNAPFLFKYLQ
ncbi:hypothetical protein [Alkalihalobacillus sp. R86527]|uniref:hypothetical protein n=1 Tax=Alkalihalobacillus sp. R86527 TaxID=3093863 RepID=UPI00366EA8CD